MKNPAEEPTVSTASPNLGDSLAARPNASSIMSAPQTLRKNTPLVVILCLVALSAVSIAVNVFTIVTILSNKSEIARLEREVEDKTEEIEDYKVRLHAQ